MSSRNQDKVTHGCARRRGRTAEYKIWAKMIARCTNPNDTSWRWYGARGVTVCSRWLRFENFYADMGPRPSSGHSIDRFPNSSGNYEPRNCRWATDAQQTRNYGRNIQITFQGRTQCVVDWAAELGFRPSCIYQRLDRGWDLVRALTTPHRFS